MKNKFLLYFLFCFVNAALTQNIYKIGYINNSAQVLKRNRVEGVMVNPDSAGKDCPYDRITYDTLGRIESLAMGASDEVEFIHYSKEGAIKNIVYKLFNFSDTALITAKDTFYYKKGKLYKVIRDEYDYDKLTAHHIQYVLNYESHIQLRTVVKDSLVRSFECSSFSRPCHNSIIGELKFVYYYLPNDLIDRIIILNEKSEAMKTLYFIYTFRD
ncbi:MAG TPA: hypothetical protein VGF79_02595 [Bacteroidia bacterium]